jgi:hypothetical protein
MHKSKKVNIKMGKKSNVFYTSPMSFSLSAKNLSGKHCKLQEKNEKEKDQQKDGTTSSKRSLFDTKQTSNNKSNL